MLELHGKQPRDNGLQFPLREVTEWRLQVHQKGGIQSVAQPEGSVTEEDLAVLGVAQVLE